MIADTTHSDGRGRRLVGRVLSVVAWAFGGLLVLCLLAAVALGALVALGPVKLDAAARAAESALGEIVGPNGRAGVGEAHLDWSWREGLAVDLVDITVGREGLAAVTVPRAAIRLRVLPILIGEVRPRSLVLEAPHLAFDADAFAAEVAAAHEAAQATAAAAAQNANSAAAAQNANSTAAAQNANTPTGPEAANLPTPLPAPVSTRLAEAIEATLERAVAVARDRGFQTLAVRGGSLEVRRRDPSGQTKRVELHEIETEAVVDGPGGDLDAGVSAMGEVGRWSMRLTRAAHGDEGHHRLTFAADDVTLHDLIGPPTASFSFSLPFYPRIELDFDRTGALAGADLDLRLGAGVFRFGPEKEDEALLDEAMAHLLWRPAERAFAVETLSWAAGDTNLNLVGRLAAPVRTGAPWTIALDAERGGFRPRDVGGELVPLGGGRLSATFDPATGFFDILAAEAQFGAASVQTAGRFDLSGPEPKLKLDLAFSPMSVSDMVHVWPHWVAPDARAWMIRQAQAGRVFDARLKVDLPRLDHPETWPGSAMTLAARFDGFKFLPLGNLPAVMAAEGRLSVADRRFEAVVERGQVATKHPKRPTLDSLRFAVPDIFAKPPKGAFRFQVSGEVPGLAEIVNAEPLAALDQAGVKVDGLAGVGVVTGSVDLVFTPQIDPAKIDYRVEAQLDRFATANPIQGRRFQDGKFKVVTDPRGLEVTGRATVDGVAADVHVYEPHGGGARSAEKRDFKMVLDDAARQRIGLDLGGLVQGAVGLSVSQPNPGEPRSRVEADLGPARLYLAQVGWTKGAGVPAKATFDLVEDDKGLRVENFALDAEGVTLRGTLQLDAERQPLSAEFSKFNLRKGDDVRLKLGRGSDRALIVTVDAGSLDVRAVLQASRKPTPAGEDKPAGAEKPTPDTVLKMKVAKVHGFGDVTLADVVLEARQRGAAIVALDAKAKMPGGRPFAAVIKPEGDHRRFTVSSDDAGALLSFLDLFDRIRGGKMVLTARLGTVGTAEGTLKLSDFRLLEEPKGGRAAASRTAGDGTRQVELRRVEFDRSTDFDRASARFVQRDGVINVGEAVAKGNSVGATATGQIDLNNSRVSLSGTYIPAFGLNNLAGRIPILGAITGAGANEGLVGVTFRIVGAIEDPILAINPLSAVAPGIFRKIFEFQNEELPAVTGDPNAPTKITP